VRRTPVALASVILLTAPVAAPAEAAASPAATSRIHATDLRAADRRSSRDCCPAASLTT
jgi:hypothetical protein